MDKLKAKTLTNHDINYVLKKNGINCNIVKYRELKNFNNLYDLLGDDKCVVILYETKTNFGHWICVFENGEGDIEFFDSYGIFPDDENEFVPTDFKKLHGLYYPILSYFLYNSGKNIHFNEYFLQKHGKNINTCGRHVLTRLYFKKIPHRKYIKIFKDIIKYYGITPDDFVTIFTIFFI
jgi:hypothetical protein